MRAGLRGMLAAAAIAMSAAGPALALPRRGFALQPGSGIVKRDRPPRRRDGARQAAAQAKRERKNAKRRRDMEACAFFNRCRWLTPKFAKAVVPHG